MANDDVALKVWLRDKTRFADLFNGTIFDGKQVVKPKELEIVKGEGVAVLENKGEGEKDRGVQRYRDVIMKYMICLE